MALIVAWAVAGRVEPSQDRAVSGPPRSRRGQRATPYEVLSEFSGRVGEAYAAEDVLPRMAQVLAAGTGAEAAAVWLRVGGELRPAAVWPAGATAPQDDRVEVSYQGVTLGELSVLMPANDPMNPSKRKLVEDLASQAGLVLRNVRLIEELRASRQRLVSTQDEERRKIERNIHDGAQQQLVALAVKQRIAASVVGRDDERARVILEELKSETTQALEDLRDLARGIYPPLLADQGLVAALEAQARKSAVPVDVMAGGIGRFPQQMEAAVYFSCLEALQNVGRRSRIRRPRMPPPRRGAPMAARCSAVTPVVMNSEIEPSLPSTPRAPYREPVISHASSTIRWRMASRESSADNARPDSISLSPRLRDTAEEPSPIR